MAKKALVVLSGGQDSTTCLFAAIKEGYEVHTITFDYGQKHRIELESAMAVAALAEVPRERREVVHLGAGILTGTSPLTNPNVELEQYSDHKSLPGGLEKTFVPVRNQLFLTVAANRAYVAGCEVLVTGVCQEDNGGYPDCTQAFIDAFARCTNEGTFTGKDGAPGPLVIWTPLMNLTKSESVELALDLPGCYAALAYSHTAYDGQYPPIGKDHATLLREKGFEEAATPDPIWLRYACEQQGPARTPLNLERIRHYLPNSKNYADLADDELLSYLQLAKMV